MAKYIRFMGYELCAYFLILSYMGRTLLTYIVYSNYVPDYYELDYPLVDVFRLRTERWPIEIVELAFLKMVIFHNYVNVYQSVSMFFVI